MYYESTWQKKKKFLLFIHPFTTIPVKDVETLCHLSPTENTEIPFESDYFLPLSTLLSFRNPSNASSEVPISIFSTVNTTAEEQAKADKVKDSFETEKKILFIAFALIRKLIKEAQVQNFFFSCLFMYSILIGCVGFG
jgi:hypothetical protein